MRVTDRTVLDSKFQQPENETKKKNLYMNPSRLLKRFSLTF